MLESLEYFLAGKKHNRVRYVLILVIFVMESIYIINGKDDIRSLFIGKVFEMNRYSIQMKLFNIYCLVYVIEMYAHSKLSSKALKRLQNKRLKKLIHNAYRIPFYKERFISAGVTPKDIRSIEDLSKLPVLTKEEYREWMNDELTTEEAKYYKTTKTSGSTGIPTTNIYPPKEYAKHYMMDMFCWMKGGYNPFFGKTLTCAPGDEKVGMDSIVQRFGILRREYFSMQWDRAKIIDKINEYRPDFILGYSAELSYIAQYALENGISVHKPSYYCAGGEHVMGEQQKILSAVFGDGMINYYGCTEMADFAYRIPGVDDDGYGVIQDCVVLNVRQGNEIMSTGTGSILATPLYRKRYPLINYEIGDIVNLGIKEGYDYIFEINGRMQDIFYWKSGKRTTHKDIWLVSKEIEYIYQIRFIQESLEKIIIQVVKDKKIDKPIAEIEHYLVEKYMPLFDDNVKIDFEWFESLPPDPNGKIRNMISKVNLQNAM